MIKLSGLKIKCERAGGYQEDEKVADAEEDLGSGGVDEVLLHVLAGIPAAELQVLSSQRNLLRKEECLVAILLSCTLEYEKVHSCCTFPFAAFIRQHQHWIVFFKTEK